MPDQKMIFRGRVVVLGIETAQLPNGTQVDLEIVRHPGGAAIVAVDECNRVCLIRQFRHAAGGWLWELPAGKLEPGEAAEFAARRELAEEAGVTADHWQSLGAVYTTPGFCDEVIHLFFAAGLSPIPTQHEAHEAIEVHWKTRNEVQHALDIGEIRDAKTLVGLYRWLSRDA